MPMNLGEERSELIANAIVTIVNNYSKNDNIDGVFMNCYVEKMVPIIKLSIVYINPINFKEILRIQEQVKEIELKTNIKLSIDFCESSDYGLYGLYVISCGGVSCCSRLIDGEILFDRNEKYSDLQLRIKNLNNTMHSKLTPMTIVPSLNIPKKLKQRVYS